MAKRVEVYQKKSLFDFTVEELDEELIVRGANIPGEKLFKSGKGEENPEWELIMEQVKELYKEAASQSPKQELGHISDQELLEALLFKTREIRMKKSKIPRVFGLQMIA